MSEKPGRGTYLTVSIIVPTYNRAVYLFEAIDSVLRQTYTHWELLVVDDHSTDNTIELIKQIKDQRVKLYQTPQRIGVTGTRNVGLRNAIGDLVAFIDSDDLWAPTKLEKQVAALHQYPDAGFCLTGGYNFRILNEPVEFFYKQTEGVRYGDLFLSFFKSEVSTTTPSFIFRKQYLNEAGYFDETKSFADVDFMLRIARITKGIILYEYLFYRRLHSSNISSSDWEKGYREGLELFKAYKQLLPPKLVHTGLFKLYINTGENYLRVKNRGKAINFFLKAWAQKPFSMAPFKKIVKAVIR